jgi:hypothetical protein
VKFTVLAYRRYARKNAAHVVEVEAANTAEAIEKASDAEPGMFGYPIGNIEVVDARGVIVKQRLSHARKSRRYTGSRIARASAWEVRSLAEAPEPAPNPEQSVQPNGNADKNGALSEAPIGGPT